MSLPLPDNFHDIEIEHAHTPVPSWRSSGGSPTGEVSARSPPARTHLGGGSVTLRRKSGNDIVRTSHARSISVGSVNSVVGMSEAESGYSESPERVGAAVVSGCQSTGGGYSLPFRRVDSRRRAESGGGGSAEASAKSCLSAEAAQRIAVDPDSGHSYIVERSTVCDACPYCDDVCEVAWCSGCDERRAQLEHSYGPLFASPREGIEEQGDGGSSTSSPSTVSPDGVGYWNSGGEGDDLEAVGGSTADSRRSRNGGMSRTPSLSSRYSRKSSYTPCEIRRRKLTGACWIVCQGSVYDVTDALADHPGGKRSVLKNAGGPDRVEDFSFHSKAARKKWRQYRIGHVVDCVGENGSDVPRASRMSSSDCLIC